MKKIILTLTAVLLLAGAMNAADVKIGENKEIIIDGKPLFLLGIGTPLRNFKYMKKLGMNFFSASSAFAFGVTTEMCLAEAKKLGVYTSCSIEEFDKINKDDPTIVFWDQVDEPDYIERDKPGAIKGLIEIYQKLHAADKKPVTVCFGSMFARGVGVMKNTLYVEYAEKVADVIMTDVYPVGNVNKPDELWLMAKAMKNLEKITKGKKPLMIAVEASKIDDKADRSPNAFEVRAEAWMVIIHGAKGIYYFPHRFDKIRYTPAAIPEDVEAELMRTNREIIELNDVILSKNVAENVEVTEPEGASSAYMLKAKDGKFYLFTINMKKTPAKFKFALPGISGEVEVYGEGRKVKVSGGAIEDDFKGFEPHIYVIKK